MTRQQGISLPVVLALLLGMAMLSAAVLQSGTLHTRMATQMQMRHLAFQAAEGALRTGEQLAHTAPIPTIPGCSGGLCGTPEPAAIERWQQSGFDGWQHLSGIPEIGLPGAQFVVEYMGDAPSTPGCERIEPIPATCLRPWYKITARSAGAQGMVLLQTHYLDARVAWREWGPTS